jgi:hypothetical protein
MYRFLEYYSKFDWDKYGISLFGPVHLSSLTDLTSKLYLLHYFFLMRTH